METETYKNAKIILERFDPDAKKKAVSAIISPFIHLYIFFNRIFYFIYFYFIILFF